MIGQRYASNARTNILIDGASDARGTRSRRFPGRSGAKQLVQTLGQSVLVQLMLAMTLVAVAAMIYLAQASQAAVLAVNIHALQDDQARLQMQSANLHGTAIDLTSLTRIEAIASGQLKMSRADLATAIWITPDVPRLTPIRSESADTQRAMDQSRPVTWITDFAHAVESSL